MTALQSNQARTARWLVFWVGIGTTLLAAAAGQLAPTALAGAGPPPPPASPIFASVGDSGSYVAVNDGSFAPVANNPLDSPWALTGGASLANDSVPSGTMGSSNTVLSLPSGSSATSGCTTAPFITSIVRFFVKNTESASGQLHVQILVNGGKNGVLDGGTISAGPTWQLSPKIVVPWPNPLQGAVQLQVVLTPVGTGASFRVDDVYLNSFIAR